MINVCLKKENDSLKNQIEVLTKDFKNLEEGLANEEIPSTTEITTGNGREPGVHAETEKHLDFYSKSYDDLNLFNADAIAQLQQQKSLLNALSVQVEDIASAIEESQRYSYRYNDKIGLLWDLNSQRDKASLCELRRDRAS